LQVQCRQVTDGGFAFLDQVLGVNNWKVLTQELVKLDLGDGKDFGP
jgi:hypothetical protein